jgi:branched-chain amino acid transport system permease protein
MSYALHLSTVIAIYALLACSLNLTAGFLGLISICQAAFFGLGAYTAALLLRGTTNEAVFVAAICFLVGWAAGVALSTALFRLREDYFAIASFAFQAVATAAFFNLYPVTGGAPGIAGIEPLRFCGISLASAARSSTSLAVGVGALWLIQRALLRSPAARVLAAIREDEVSVLAAGLDPNRYRVALFAAGAGLAAMAGAFYASYMTFIDPTPFGFDESLLILCCVVLGGSGTSAGPIFGAVALVCLPEALRFAGFPSAVAANLRQIVFGTALVAIIILRPTGFQRADRGRN